MSLDGDHPNPDFRVDHFDRPSDFPVKVPILLRNLDAINQLQHFLGTHLTLCLDATINH